MTLRHKHLARAVAMIPCTGSSSGPNGADSIEDIGSHASAMSCAGLFSGTPLPRDSGRHSVAEAEKPEKASSASPG